MAGDFEDTYDLGNMTDEELVELVREQLDDYPDLDSSRIDIAAEDGAITLSGRVGTDGELQTIGQVLSDVIGVEHVTNELVVDPLTRVHHDEAADVANSEVYGSPRGLRGGANRTEDTAAHLLDDEGAEQFGTGDVGEAIERGYSYNPPVSPTQDGQDEGGEEH
jgi:hypothetical protein